MKKSFIIFILLTIVSGIVNSQTIVSTDPENKNALIEEFTGIACGFCPYGHKEVEEFITAHPGDGFSIAYHQGYFAIPDPGQPDYTTPYGDGLGSYFGVNGWPNALINRHDFGGGMLYNLDLWQQYAGEIITQPAYANIACEASVDVQTRQLSVHVEVYYTGNSPIGNNKLNVALLQNNVKGVQFSSWFNPDAITPDGEYLHQHMFRNFITGQWGETVSPTTTSTFIDKYYSYTIPEEINDIPLWLGNLKVLSFLAENEIEVVTAHESGITLTNFAHSVDAGIVEIEIPTNSCSFVEPQILLSNYGSETITTVDFEIIINGDDPVNYSWTSEGLLPFTVAEIDIPAVFYGDMGTNEITIEITSVNNSPDENPANNNVTDSFSQSIEAALPVTLYLTTDVYFGTSWYLYDDQNNVIQQGSGYAENTSYEIELIADAGCYKFVMTDLDGFFFGSYSLKDGNNVTLVQTNSGFGNEEITAFTLPLYQPTAIIDASTTIACLGNSIQFYDASTGGPDTWMWTFEGGNPSTSVEKNPVVTYSVDGSFDVSLQVSNSIGSDFVTIQDYITITSLSYGNLALGFDGTNDYVEVNNESAFDFTTEITLEAWIKPNDLAGTQGILSKNFGNNAHPYQIRLLDDEIIFGFYSNTIGWQPVQTTNANLQTGEWTHIACTYNMQQVKIYVNGIQKASANKTFQIPLNDQPFEIGRTKDVAYEYFNGTIDEVRAWDVALSAVQISENMCINFTGSTDPHLVANFKFNECGGTLLTDIKNGNDGELINMEGDEWIESQACPGYMVTFLVLEDPGSSPVENATVNMNGTIRYTDENGEAFFEGYEAGSYSYSVSKEGLSFVSGIFDLVDENITIEIHLIIDQTENLPKRNTIIYPNPTSGLLNVQLEKPALIELLNSGGQRLASFEGKQGNICIDFGSLPKGFYYLKITDGAQVFHHKIILN